MAIWPFNRRNNKIDQVPAEVREYYQAEQRERVGVAWLLALGTLVVTILLALGLFFGGRWIWRSAFENDKQPTNVATQTSKDKKTDTDQAPAGTPAPSTAPSRNTTPSSRQPNSGSRTPTSTPRTGDNNLPNTGPGDTLAVFVGATLIGYLLHRLYVRKSA
jgi:hypothetical protein